MSDPHDLQRFVDAQHSIYDRALAELKVGERPARQILGSPDDMKLRSSMTLFAAVAPERSTFQTVLDAFFAADPDPATLSRLDR